MNDEGASEVIGTVLLVGMTVVIAALFGLVLLNQEGPSDVQHAQLQYKLSAGPDAVWSTGDELITVRHKGGEPFEAIDTRILVTQGGVTTEITGAGLTGGFSDGEFTIGESWTYIVTAAANESLEVRTITPRQLHSEWSHSTTVAAPPAPGACSPDVTDPIVGLITITPADINTDTSGTILVTAVASDACMLQSVDLTYDTGSPTTIPMTLSGTWQATVPDLGWSGLGGGTLALTVTATDAAVNTATGTLNEAIETVSTNFPFHDANCSGSYDPGESSIAGDLADGKYDEDDQCIVLPAGWGAQSRDEWDIDGASIIVQVDLSATDGELKLKSKAGDIDVSGRTLTATEKIRIEVELQLLASNATLTGESVDIDDDDNANTVMDFRDATISSTGNGGNGDRVDIRNDGDWIRMDRAIITSNKDVNIRSSGFLNADNSRITSGDDLLFQAQDEIRIDNGHHIANDNIVISSTTSDQVYLQAYCGEEDDSTIPVQGTIVGIPNILPPCKVPV